MAENCLDERVSETGVTWKHERPGDGGTGDKRSEQ
jgi:hypothetical protein